MLFQHFARLDVHFHQLDAVAPQVSDVQQRPVTLVLVEQNAIANPMVEHQPAVTRQVRADNLNIRISDAGVVLLREAPADVALAWLLQNEAVTAPIIGPRTLAQLEGSMRSLEIELSEATMARLDEIFPGPGGQAPEAYAW